MELLFTFRNRERLLVGQLLSQKRPGSGKRSQWLEGGGREERRDKERAGGSLKHRQVFPFSLTWHTFLPPVAATRRILVLSLLSSRENKEPVFMGALAVLLTALAGQKAAEWPEPWASPGHTPEWLPACVTVTLTAATPVLPALHPCIHGSEKPSFLHDPLTPDSFL